MYTLEQLQQKTLKELKEIGWELNVMPEGDRRCRQNWIDALVGTQPPLLQLLEVSQAEVESVEEPIEVQAQEPIEIQRQEPPIDTTETQSDTDLQDSTVQAQRTPIDSKFGCIVYPKASVKPIAPTDSFNDEQPPNRGDNGRGRREIDPKLSQSAIGFCASPVTFSPRFLATYPPYFGEVRYKAEATGQLNLLEPETDDEPPDPDDFESLDAFREAIALWDAEHPEPLEISLDSFCEWAPCPDDWYEPAVLLEPSEVMELSPASESSSTYNFSIPTFDAWCDRANRHNDKDEPPDTGIFARLPKPKPPSFPPMVTSSPRAIGYSKKCLNANRQTTYCLAAGSSSQSGRDPPGGDFM